MEDGDLDSGLFGIALGSESDTENAPSSKTNGNSADARDRKDRNAQSEEVFQAVRRNYRVKVENGELWKTIKLPLSSQVTKPEAQALLHAVEELYFFGRFVEAASFVRNVLDCEAGGDLDEDTRKTLKYYESKCNENAGEVGKRGQ